MPESPGFPPGFQPLILHQTYRYEDFDLVYEGDLPESQDAGLVTAQERRHIFQVVTPDRDFMVEVRYGQLPPQPRSFSVGPAVYEIQILQKKQFVQFQIRKKE